MHPLSTTIPQLMHTEKFIIYTVAIFLGSFLASVYLIPKVKKIVSSKQLMDEPNSRSSHQKSTPSLGGISFYIIYIIGLYFNNEFDAYNISMSILPGMTILFFFRTERRFNRLKCTC